VVAAFLLRTLRLFALKNSLTGESAVRIADGIEMLEISAPVMGSPRVINPTLIWDRQALMLVDTGYPGQMHLIRKAVEEASFSFDKLYGVILTHHDIDHIGNLAEIVRESANRVKVLAHEEEIPYIDGSERPLKLARMEADWQNLSEDERQTVEKLSAAFEKSVANVDYALSDGQGLPFAGGVRVVSTPGHTMGHICLYHESSRTLIAGDALCVDQGLLATAAAPMNFDPELGLKSLKRLAEFDIRTVICYHGGLYTDHPNQRIARLALA
jgi:glyoxylase-like metal-dependent hydrolase (beta-lactamase superfamily II)